MSKKNRALRRRCPRCKKLRGFCEPDGRVGGVTHPHRKPWIKVAGKWICGWCAGTETGERGRGTVPHGVERVHYVAPDIQVVIARVERLHKAAFREPWINYKDTTGVESLDGDVLATFIGPKAEANAELSAHYRLDTLLLVSEVRRLEAALRLTQDVLNDVEWKGRSHVSTHVPRCPSCGGCVEHDANCRLEAAKRKLSL